MTLNIPQRRDPIARVGLFALVGAVVWVALASATQPQPTAAQDIILLATPTPIAPTAALPTPAPDNPALALAAPTAAPAGWLDQTLASAGQAASQFADSQAAQYAQEHAEAQAAADQAAAEAAARQQYLANVGSQEPHSPRGDVSAPPAYTTGPIVQPVENNERIIVSPDPYTAPIDQMAAAPPAISAEQAAVIGARQSNGCAPPAIFYPRTGCHVPGSGGPQPGAVGEP